jgi:1-deoxy-D-xylulose-5-phosphate synthase
MDIAMFKVFPDVALLACSDEQNLRAGLEFMRTYDAGASFIRYPRDNVMEVPIQAQVAPYVLGKANLVKPARRGKPDVAILAYGTMVYNALGTIDQLEQQGYDVAVYDARFAKPIDIELVQQLVEANIPILTLEDHAIVSGFGASVLEACNDARVATDGIHRLGMPMRWFYQDSRVNQLAQAGLDSAGIARKVRAILDGVGAVNAHGRMAVKSALK